MTAYAYLRKSVSRDTSREVSHEVQEEAVRSLAARHGDTDLTLLSDWDKSGRLGADKRPGYRALLEAIENGRATAIYSYSLSRLGRSVSELARLIADCDARGVPVRIAVDAVDTSTASGRLLTHVLASVAAFEADVASERVRAANAAKVARGESLGSTPVYGAAPGEDAQAVLDAFRQTGSYSAAARLLNEQGVKPRSSKRGVWWPSSVAVVAKRMDPSITIQRPTRGYKVGGTDFTLARLLRCPTCGTLLSGTRDREGRRVRYSCRLGGSMPHQRVTITESHILPAIRDEVAHLRTPDEVATTGYEDESQQRNLEARRERILDMYEAGHIDREERERRLRLVLEDMNRVQSRQVILTVPTIDWEWPPKVINRVLRAILAEVRLDPETFQPTGFEWTVPEWRA